ncbi:MAG: hypothetical protein AB1422_09780 [bacterium]
MDDLFLDKKDVNITIQDNLLWINLDKKDVDIAIHLKSCLYIRPEKLSKKIGLNISETKQRIKNLFQKRYLLPIVHINWNVLPYQIYATLIIIKDVSTENEKTAIVQLIKRLSESHLTLYVYENYSQFQLSVGIFGHNEPIEENPIFCLLKESSLVEKIIYDRVDMIFKEAGRFDSPKYHGAVRYYFSENDTGDSLFIRSYDPPKLSHRKIEYYKKRCKTYHLSENEKKLIEALGNNPIPSVHRLSKETNLSKLRVKVLLYLLIKKKIISPTVIIKDESGTERFQLYIKICDFVSEEVQKKIKTHLLNLDLFCVVVSLEGNNYNFVLAAHTRNESILLDYIEKNIFSLYPNHMRIDIVKVKWIYKFNTVDISERIKDNQMPPRHFPWNHIGTVANGNII